MGSKAWTQRGEMVRVVAGLGQAEFVVASMFSTIKEEEGRRREKEGGR